MDSIYCNLKKIINNLGNDLKFIKRILLKIFYPMKIIIILFVNFFIILKKKRLSKKSNGKF